MVVWRNINLKWRKIQTADCVTAVLSALIRKTKHARLYSLTVKVEGLRNSEGWYNLHFTTKTTACLTRNSNPGTGSALLKSKTTGLSIFLTICRRAIMQLTYCMTKTKRKDRQRADTAKRGRRFFKLSKDRSVKQTQILKSEFRSGNRPHDLYKNHISVKIKYGILSAALMLLSAELFLSRQTTVYRIFLFQRWLRSTRATATSVFRVISEIWNLWFLRPTSIQTL